jgi:hypothetical protein
MPVSATHGESTTRMHTRILVRVDSHTTGTDVSHGQTLNLTSDVITLSTSKNTKMLGKFQIQLLPRRNYENLVFPNDVVNIYADPGDGKRGFVRVMMGYVDRVEREETVDDNGAMSTRYTVIGSDFQKAIDKTFIYFNEYMRTRLDERFTRTSTGTSRPNQGNFAGIAMRSAGITIAGTPADFVENFLRILLGFQQQWVLPDSYAKARPSLRDMRSRAVQRAKAHMPASVKDLVSSLGFNPEELDKNVDDVLAEAARQVAFGEEENAQRAADASLGSVDARISAAVSLQSNANLIAFRSLVHAVQDASLPIGIYDLLNMDFIEALAIDGYNFNSAIWQAGNQTISQFLYGHSNEMVNELIFDLRPVTETEGLSAGPYSREPDELGINTSGMDGFPATVPAVKYVPSVVFREYPYSVVNNINLNELVVAAPGPGQDAILAGNVLFGPVFAVNPNTPGRHIYTYDEVLHPSPSEYLRTAKAVKHLDCVVIYNTDIVHTALGRSDDDVVNAFHLYAVSPIPMDGYRDQLGNFNPIVNQVSISRHGMRLREMSTEFANYGNFPGGGQQSNRFPRKNLIRWTMLMDHWFLHNPEYLTGNITLRGMPELRVGYRLDWYDRSESYYVESVHHQWSFPGAFTTTVEVSRGQRNDPFPAYIPPVFLNDKNETSQVSSGNRSRDGRLAQYFSIKDTRATINATTRRDPVNVGPNTVDTYAALIQKGGKSILQYVSNEGGSQTLIPTVLK